MNTCNRQRFPPDIISYLVWLYHRFILSHRDIEDLLVERGITVSREAIRLWCIKFGAIYARRLKRQHRGYGDTFDIDEVFVGINGKQRYLWGAVDQDGEVVDVDLQAKREEAAAKRFLRRFQGWCVRRVEQGGCLRSKVRLRLSQKLTCRHRFPGRTSNQGQTACWPALLVDPGVFHIGE